MRAPFVERHGDRLGEPVERTVDRQRDGLDDPTGPRSSPSPLRGSDGLFKPSKLGPRSIGGRPRKITKMGLRVSGLQQWLLMAPVIGDILHQSIYNLRRLSRPFG